MSYQSIFILACPLLCAAGASEVSFQGTIEATLIRGSHTENYTYSVGANVLRVARNETGRPYAANLVDLDSGAITMIYPHNRSFIRLDPAARSPAVSPGFPDLPPSPHEPPTGTGPRADTARGLGMPASGVGRARIGLGDPPRVPPLPEMPGMPMARMMTGPEGGAERGPLGVEAWPVRRRSRKIQFSPTGQTTNLFGYACARYELRQRNRVMEIWATEDLLPFQRWMQNPPRRAYGPPLMEERWGGLLQARNLFPLQMNVRRDDGAPLPFEFKVGSIVPRQFGVEDESLFQPPAEYREVEPLPFWRGAGKPSVTNTEESRPTHGESP